MIYNKIPFQSVCNYFHSILKQEEIISIVPVNKDQNVQVTINLDSPLQLHQEHRLVLIDNLYAPTELKNFPKKKNNREIELDIDRSGITINQLPSIYFYPSFSIINLL